MVARTDKNVGFIESCNAGVQLAEGELVLLLNSDTEAFPNWLDPMVELFENEKVGVVGPKLVFPRKDDKEQFRIQSCGGYYNFVGQPKHRHLGWGYADPRANKLEQVDWVTGAALMTRRDLFMKLGGLDPAYGFGYYDDPDYCERVKQAGYEVWYQPKSSFIHLVGSSVSSANNTEDKGRQSAKRFRENGILFAQRWAGKLNLSDFA